MAYLYPYGDTQQLNLDWLIEQWNEVKSQIDGSLQAEIDRVEAAITDLLTARDEAVAAQTAAQASAQAAAGSASTASGAASTAQAQAQAAAASAATAGAHASDAQQYMLTAQQEAQAANNSAGAAANSANTANGAKQDAQMYAQQASGSAQNAQGSAVAAQQQFTLADAARQAAQGAASDAADSAQEAQDVLDSIPEDYSGLSEDVSELKTAIYYNTDNLLDFQTEGFWVNQDLDGVERGWAVSTAENIQVTGGQELYTALKDLSTNIFGTNFNIRVREYDANGNILVPATTYSSIDSTNPVHYTLNADTTQIRVCLNTNDWQKPISPSGLIELNPYIYAGFNSSITNATVYHKQASIINKHSTDINNINSIIGTFLSGIMPRSTGTGFPEINTTLKNFTLFSSMCLIDRRLVNGKYYVINSDIVCNYSSISSTAIVFAWDIDNNTVVAFAYNADINLAKFIPICLFRSTNGAVCANIPINVDNRLFGGVNLSLINQGSVWNNPNILTINHRGYTNIAPENTLPAFKLSKDYGFDGVETDVRFTSDGVAVLLHDATIDRTSNGTGNIADMTYSQVLQYDFGSWKSTEYEGTKIPTFEQFMTVCKRLGLHPYIEIKTGTEQQIKELAETVILCGMNGKVTFISYNVYQLQYIKDVLNEVRLGLITDIVDATVITSAAALKTSDNYVFVDLSNYTPVDSAVSSLAEANMPLEVYANGEWTLATANAYLTGITTDTGNPAQYMYNNWNSAL